MKSLSNLRVGVRLGAAFGVVSLLLCIVAGVGLWGGASQASGTNDVASSVRLTHDVMQVKFRGADFNGWQTAYAFDIVRGLKGATSNGASSRQAFLASAASFRQELAAVQHERLTAAERASTQTASTAFN